MSKKLNIKSPKNVAEFETLISAVQEAYQHGANSLAIKYFHDEYSDGTIVEFKGRVLVYTTTGRQVKNPAGWLCKTFAAELKAWTEDCTELAFVISCVYSVFNAECPFSGPECPKAFWLEWNDFVTK